ncbi:MAG: hypothetical protein NTU98_03830 [Bacteroidetes bacterium]|nr:hypothetical protein [Bacteroidota bacterium]
MKRQIFFLILSGLLVILLIPGIHAQNPQFTLTLFQPPPGQMNIEELWNLTIYNSGTDATIYLRGTITEKRDGLIADGTSSSFLVKNGPHRVNTTEVQPVTSHVYIKKYQDIIQKTGTAPDGIYVICVVAFDAKTNKELARDCIEQPIQNLGMLNLTFPTKGSTLKEDNPVFQWEPQPSKEIVTYTLRIYRSRDNQSISEPPESNPLFFEKADLPTPYYQWSPSAKEQFSPNQMYIWQVTASTKTNSRKSEVWNFVYSNNQCEAYIDSVHVVCDGKDQLGATKYKVTVFFRDNITANNCTCSLGTYNTGAGAGSGFQPGMPYLEVLPGPGSATISNASPPNPVTAASYLPLTSGPLIPPITFNISNIILPFSFQIDYGCTCTTNGIKTSCSAPVPWQIDSLPDCGCCDGFTRQVDNLKIHEDSANNYCLHGVMTAGPKPICKIQAEIVSFSYNVFSINNPPNGVNYCPFCVWPSSRFGNFTSPVSSIGCLTPALTLTPPYTYSREIIWKGNKCNVDHVPFHFPIILPDTNPLTGCCQDSIKMCIRFSFTDSACITCDTVICFRFQRSPVSTLKIGYNENSPGKGPYYPQVRDGMGYNREQTKDEQKGWRSPDNFAAYLIPQESTLKTDQKHSILNNK